MTFPFIPTYRIDSITEITPDDLRRCGISLLMLDFDNTIVPYTSDIPTEQMKAWFETMKQGSIPLCIVSNSRNNRVKVFCEQYGLDCITHAKKPFPKGIRACLDKYGVKPECCALAGDQIYTDTLGANCAGVRSILVRAIHNHNFWLKLRHIAELPFIFVAKNRRLNK